MHYVAFGVLMRGAFQNHRARKAGANFHDGEAVLKLVAETYRAARLVKAQAPEKARTDDLRGQKIVEKRV
jgi:hypothetical protein